LSGNDAVSYGLVKAGLESYIAYPMTPASSVLHTMAANSKEFGLKVIHAESEIGVIMMANGMAYAGNRVAVGTSGGGFCLMTEGVSLAGMGEYPVAIVMSQRSGPATGLPTYNAQADLHFVLNAGHGEFLRIVIAPGDAEQSYFWSGVALNLAWKYQTPSIILIDKAVSESVFTFDPKNAGQVKKENEFLWNGKGEYKRYKFTQNGISPLAFPGDKKAIVKGTSYEHDESGITTEEPTTAALMQEKRLIKEIELSREIDKKYEAVKVYGNKKSEKALICWGSNLGVCREVAEELDIRLVQPIVLSPMPLKQLERALYGVSKLINIETNATAQMATLLKQYGVEVNDVILKYDSRPFSEDELIYNVRKVLK
jgi:2-oxoglutarate ferredoxin oxidoreductase subunit alpha